jgi:hypothetical protein
VSVSQREHPRVARKKVAFEQDPEPAIGDAGEILTGRMPFAEIARKIRFERAPHG